MAAAATSGSVAAESGPVGPTEMEGSSGLARPKAASGGLVRVVELKLLTGAGPRLATLGHTMEALPPRPIARSVVLRRLARQAWGLRKDLEAPQIHAPPGRLVLFRREEQLEGRCEPAPGRRPLRVVLGAGIALAGLRALSVAPECRGHAAR